MVRLLSADRCGNKKPLEATLLGPAPDLLCVKLQQVISATLETAKLHAIVSAIDESLDLGELFAVPWNVGYNLTGHSVSPKDVTLISSMQVFAMPLPRSIVFRLLACAAQIGWRPCTMRLLDIASTHSRWLKGRFQPRILLHEGIFH